MVSGLKGRSISGIGHEARTIRRARLARIFLQPFLPLPQLTLCQKLKFSLPSSTTGVSSGACSIPFMASKLPSETNSDRNHCLDRINHTTRIKIGLALIMSTPGPRRRSLWLVAGTAQGANCLKCHDASIGIGVLMKSLKFALLCLLLVATSADAQSGSGSGAIVFTHLPIGGAGAVIGVSSVPSANVLLARTDQFNCYIRTIANGPHY